MTRSARWALVVAGAALASCGSSDTCGEPGPGWLAYAAATDEIRIARIDGTCDRAVSGGDSVALSPSFSVAAREVAFTDYGGGRQRLLRVSLASQMHLAVPVDLGPLDPVNPAYSPDGTRIAFEAREGLGDTDLYVMTLGGGAPEPLVPDEHDDSGPDWSEDGSSLFFGSNRAGRWQIWRVDLDGGGLAQVTSDANAVLTCGATACPVLGRPAVTPDGAHVVFTRQTPSGGSRVVVLELESGAERVLADFEEAQPDVDPTGEYVAVMSTAFGDAEVLVRRFSDGELAWRVTSRLGVDGAPAFAR